MAPLVLNVARSVLSRVDRFQQRHLLLAFPFAVLKKFGDDRAGSLAALVAYYGFFSLFPLLVVLVSVLSVVLAGQPELRERIVNSALGQFPVIGDEIARRADIAGLTGNWLRIALGSLGAVWAGMGVAQAASRGFNTVWDVPRARWPNFFERRLRALLMLVILGTTVIASTFAGAIASSGALPAFLPDVTGWAISLLLNLGVFTLAYQVLTARDLKWSNVLPGAAVAAVGWTLLQAIGGYYVTRRVTTATDVYGTFAVVIGLLVWIALGSQLALLCAEVNVVWNNRLWPRSLVQPPLSDGDREVYRRIVHRARMRPEVRARVWFVDENEPTDGIDDRTGSGGR